MKAKDVMTAKVLSVRADTAILEAARLMLQNHISGLPVIDSDSHLIGIVTEGDLLRRAETATERKRPRWLEFLLGPGKLADEYVHTHARRVEDVMTRDLVTATEQTPLDKIVDLMERHRIKRLPVTRRKKLVGIVSRANLLQALASIARETRPSALDDSAIRRSIVAELNKVSWAASATINVIVRDGIVDLWGSIFDERQRQGARVIAENTPGVKAVRDHLAWFDATSGMIVEAPEQELAERRVASR